MPIGCLEIWSLLTEKLCTLENKLDLKFDETRQILKFGLKFEEKILINQSLLRKLKNLTKFKLELNR